MNNQYRDRQAGQVTTFVVVLILALFALAGLVLDGGRYFTAQRHTRNTAAAAARAGAQGVAEDSLRDPTRGVALDPVDAYNRAQAFLTASDATGTIEVSTDTVTVTVTTKVSPLLLGIVGVGDRTITATETAAAVPGP
jgi:Flp pilus assembly protein TadG